jgi:hypothetical protein
MATREIFASIVEKVGGGRDAAKGMSHRVRANQPVRTRSSGASSRQTSWKRRGGHWRTKT